MCVPIRVTVPMGLLFFRDSLTGSSTKVSLNIRRNPNKDLHSVDRRVGIDSDNRSCLVLRILMGPSDSLGLQIWIPYKTKSSLKMSLCKGLRLYIGRFDDLFGSPCPPMDMVHCFISLRVLIIDRVCSIN